jgi:glycerol uptake facilitator-like aquaporin
MTATLLAVILAVVSPGIPAIVGAAVAIGGAIALASLVGGPVSGASLNPARSLGPALVSGQLGSLWIYLTAPLVGGVVGAFAYDALEGRTHP